MSAADTAVAYALKQLGIRYTWGGATPEEGFDCSGLVVASYRAAGITLPHFTGLLMTAGSPVLGKKPMAGDLCFPFVGHVKLAISTTQTIEAPRKGDVVCIAPMRSWIAVRRIVDPGQNHVVMGDNGIVNPSTGPNVSPLVSAVTMVTPSFYIRAGEMLAGIILLVMGLVILSGNGPAIKTKIQEITNTAKTAATVAAVV